MCAAGRAPWVMIGAVTSDVSPLPDIPVDVFGSVDIRVGRVVAVEQFPQARVPAYKLTVDFGVLGELRTSDTSRTTERPIASGGSWSVP